MRVNRFLAAGLGLLSVLPLVGVPLFLYVLVPQAQAAPTPTGLSLLVQCFFLTVGAGLAMMTYVAFVWRSRRVPRAQKKIWSLRIIIGSFVTMPVFWYLYIWKDRPLEELPTLEQFVSGAA